MVTKNDVLTKEAMGIIGVKNPYIMYLMMKIYDVRKVRLEKINGKHHAVYLRADIERLGRLWQGLKSKEV